MGLLRKCLAAAMVLALLPAVFLQVSAAGETDGYIRQLLTARMRGQEKKAGEAMTELEKADSEQAEIWQELLDRWDWINKDMEVNKEVLPDGLPEDDSLCILVMGYCLNPNGSVKPELIDRLQVAASSAEKYPNAYILCTGGPTASDGVTTEAGQMAQWLAASGIDESRILVEDKSMSTTENAINTYALLREEYPQVKSVAVITSSYHIYQSCLVFDAASILNAAGDDSERLDVVANAVCTGYGEGSIGMYSQAWSVAEIAGIRLNY